MPQQACLNVAGGKAHISAKKKVEDPTYPNISNHSTEMELRLLPPCLQLPLLPILALSQRPGLQVGRGPLVKRAKAPSICHPNGPRPNKKNDCHSCPNLCFHIFTYVLWPKSFSAPPWLCCLTSRGPNGRECYDPIRNMAPNDCRAEKKKKRKTSKHATHRVICEKEQKLSGQHARASATQTRVICDPKMRVLRARDLKRFRATSAACAP